MALKYFESSPDLFRLQRLVVFSFYVRDVVEWGICRNGNLNKNKQHIRSQTFFIIVFKPFREHVLLLERKVHECCEKCFTSHVSSGYKEGSKRRKQKQREELKKKKSTKGSY